MLGLVPGDAKIIRNAGARVTDDALRSLILAVNLLDVDRICVVQHTDCAMAGSTDDELRARIGADDDLELLAMTDQTRSAARRRRRHPRQPSTSRRRPRSPASSSTCTPASSSPPAESQRQPAESDSSTPRCAPSSASRKHFAVEAAAVAAERAVGRDHAVTRHDDGDRVLAVGRAHGALRAVVHRCGRRARRRTTSRRTGSPAGPATRAAGTRCRRDAWRTSNSCSSPSQYALSWSTTSPKAFGSCGQSPWSRGAWRCSCMTSRVEHVVVTAERDQPDRAVDACGRG